MNLKSTKRHIDVWLFSNELKNKTYSVFSVGLDFIFQTVKHRTQLKGYKETLTSIENMILDDKESMLTFNLCEHVPDMTYKDDIERINNFLN